MARLEAFGTFESNFVSLVREDGCLDLYDGLLRAKDPDGAVIFDQVQPADYLEYIAEEVRPWSYMKFPFIRPLGPRKGWYRVGPLARMNNCDRIDTPIAERRTGRVHANGRRTPRPFHDGLPLGEAHRARTLRREDQGAPG